MKCSPQGDLWFSDDAAADVRYVTFKKPSHAPDSELTDDIIVRYEEESIVGWTILHPSQRQEITRNPCDLALIS